MHSVQAGWEIGGVLDAPPISAPCNDQPFAEMAMLEVAEQAI